MTCSACEAARERRYSGGLYRLECLDCCVRLVASTWPSRERAAAMLAVIERRTDWPRAEVLARVAEVLRAQQAAGCDERADACASPHCAKPGPGETTMDGSG